MSSPDNFQTVQFKNGGEHYIYIILLNFIIVKYITNENKHVDK